MNKIRIYPLLAQLLSLRGFFAADPVAIPNDPVIMTRDVFKPHDYSHGGGFYGNGIRQQEYELRITPADIDAAGGSKEGTLAVIARKICERPYFNCNPPRFERVVEELFAQNPTYATHRLEPGNVLVYKQNLQVGLGITVWS
ncbi:hypothetical protein HZB02_00370 [Candidatus Woesearchaeota archaeon]|nr:hypothetical protein [Candidatus Woesearchaeota archaeon]